MQLTTGCTHVTASKESKNEKAATADHFLAPPTVALCPACACATIYHQG
jgi:hypothetical protein